MMDKVSVIVPIYNVESKLEKCIKSLLMQTYSNIEIIIIDDGSSDRSLEIAMNYAKEHDMISVYTIPHRGVSNARNFGVERAVGEYICFVDGDDYVENVYCEKLVSAIEDADMAMCGAREYKRGRWKEYFIRDGQYGQIDFLKILLKAKGYSFVVWNKIYNRQFLVDNNIKFIGLNQYEDMLYTLQIALKAKKTRIISDILYNYIRREKTLSSSVNKKRIADYKFANEYAYELLKNENILLQEKYTKNCLEYFYVNLEHLAYIFAIDNNKEDWELLQTSMKSLLAILTDIKCIE